MKNIITVVTPSFNQGQFIEATIKSVISQKGNFYIDYIVMDGGSKDKSIEMIKKYEKLVRKKPNISYRWVSKKDKGQVDALRKGFDLAKGNILCWLNSDDVYIGNKVFQKVFDYFRADKNLQMLSGDGYVLNKKGKKVDKIIVKELNLKENLFLDYHILQPSTFIKKEIYHKKYLQLKYKVAFDVNFYVHFLVNKVKYKKVSDLFSGYRFYPEIKTLSLAKTRFSEHIPIALSYSKNYFFLFISIIYRYFEMILIRKTDNKIFYAFFLQLKKFSYSLITGRTERL